MKKSVKILLIITFAFLVLFAPFLSFQGVVVEAESFELISTYTTYFNEKDGGRSENIRIASRLIDGVTLQAYGEFSFNQTVGKRSESAGFKEAKIIVNGSYVQGVGGGVCQVSTTLYNSALKAGLTVTEFHPHSLRVGYVPPSRDAMVSTHSDLKLFNPYDFPVRLRAEVKGGNVTVRFYGKKSKYRYEIVSEILGGIAPPPPIVKEGEKEDTIRQEVEGTKSEAYLEIYLKNALLTRRRLRVDEYRPVQGIIVKKIGG